MNEKLLVIDDEATLNEMLALSLTPKGFEVLSSTSGQEGLRLAHEAKPSLIILDIMMPEMDGYETCARLRELSDVPILMLTAKTREEDMLRGFKAGADDYVKKPFSIRELEARIYALLKRGRNQDQALNVYEDSVLKVDLTRQHVYRKGEMIHLTPTEFRLLSCLVRNQGSIKSHQELLTEVWGPAYADATACLSLYIRYLREKLEDDPSHPQYIRTKWGTGYWFAAQNDIS